MSNIITITADVTAVAIGTPVAMDATPLLGGAGREARVTLEGLPITSTFLLEGAPTDAATGVVPVEGSALWTTLATLTSTSAAAFELADLPAHIRVNTTVLDADGPDVLIHLVGVQ